ncbi:MAG: tryptophan-rich sensory protein [bacterium]
MNKNLVRQWVNVIAVLAMIAINILANALPFNGQNTGAISDRFAVFFVPAGYVFSIWGLIYIGLLLFAIYQALPSQRDNPRLVKIGYWFAFSSLANIVWLFLWHYLQFTWTIFAMLALLISLLVIYARLGIGSAVVSPLERWMAQAPFSVYLGWISVATIANVTQLLDYLRWSAWGIAPEIWAVILLVVATLLSSAMSFRRGDVAYSLVIAWAFIGIALKQAATPLVSIAAWAATAVVIVDLAAASILHARRRIPSRKNA